MCFIEQAPGRPFVQKIFLGLEDLQKTVLWAASCFFLHFVDKD